MTPLMSEITAYIIRFVFDDLSDEDIEKAYKEISTVTGNGVDYVSFRRNGESFIEYYMVSFSAVVAIKIALELCSTSGIEKIFKRIEIDTNE